MVVKKVPKGTFFLTNTKSYAIMIVTILREIQRVVKMSANEKLDPVEVVRINQKRLSELSNEKTRLQMKKEQNEEMLKKLKDEAMTLFGTSDLEQLRNLYTKYRTEDKEAALRFVESLDSAENIINSIKRDLAGNE